MAMMGLMMFDQAWHFGWWINSPHFDLSLSVQIVWVLHLDFFYPKHGLSHYLSQTLRLWVHLF